MERRCDQVLNCLDGSDEDKCRIVIIDKSHYRKSSPPKPKDDGKLNITADLMIQSVDNILELESSFRIQFAIRIAWTDHRLSFRNLRKDSQSNIVEDEIANSLWIPSISFPDAIGSNYLGYDKNAFLFVERNSDGQIAGVEETHEGIGRIRYL